MTDCLGITHTHMVAGALGGFLTGLFATTEGIAAFADTNPGGAIDGNGRQVWLQIVGALFIFGWNIVWTSLIMLFISRSTPYSSLLLLQNPLSFIFWNVPEYKQHFRLRSRD